MIADDPLQTSLGLSVRQLILPSNLPSSSCVTIKNKPNKLTNKIIKVFGILAWSDLKISQKKNLTSIFTKGIPTIYTSLASKVLFKNYHGTSFPLDSFCCYTFSFPWRYITTTRSGTVIFVSTNINKMKTFANLSGMFIVVKALSFSSTVDATNIFQIWSWQENKTPQL